MGKAKPKAAASKAKGAGGVPGGAILAAALVVAVAAVMGLLFPWGVAAPEAPPEQPVAQQKAESRGKSKKPRQRPPPPPSATVPDAERCRSLAATGHCAQGDVQRQCGAACAAWRGLSQIQRECAGYAEGGECGRNPAYMLTTCATECAAWEAAKGITIDRESRCVEWSLLGRCTREPEVMASKCATSCAIQARCQNSSFTGWSIGACDKALRCEIVDKEHDCRARALRAECAAREGAGATWRRAAHMAEVCFASCAELDLDGLLSAQRSEGRVRAAPLLDPPAVHARRFERCWLPGWPGHNHYKLSLPTRCAAPRALPWQRRRVPAARTRAPLSDELTCPVDVSRHTPRAAARDRLVRLDAKHTPHEVRVQQVVASPRVRLLHDFLSEAEAARLLVLAEPLFERSPVRSVATDRRTSSTATLGGPHARDWAVAAVRERIAAFSGYDLDMLEPLQVVRYHPGEKYESHHDSFDLCDFAQRPRRHLTFLIYLNDLPGGGAGHTAFPRLNLMLEPKARAALVFNDVLDNGQDDERTEHAGNAPAAGVKYAINCWIRAGPVSSLGLG